MSAFEDLERAFKNARSPELKAALALLKVASKTKAYRLKAQRKAIDEQAREIFKAHYDPTRPKNERWDSKVAVTQFRAIMSKRHKLHEEIAKLVPEKIEPIWDSP